MLDSQIKEKIKILIEKHCGMMITEVHNRQMETYLEKRVAEKNISGEDFYILLTTDYRELIELINAVVVNETYFFREEKQFHLLKTLLESKYAGRNVLMWSAACSTGEEPYSLAAMAIACKTKPAVYATDIDTDALMRLKNGTYGANSFRQDGHEFMNLLDNYMVKTKDSKGLDLYAVKPELKSKLICGRANLLDLNSSPQTIPQNNSVDFIFIRNVFIYFNREARNLILRSLVEKLKDGGYLFFSISEIAGINPQEAGVPLTKINQNGIYFFQKVNGTQKTFDGAKNTTGSLTEIERRQKYLENLKREKNLEAEKEPEKTERTVSGFTQNKVESQKNGVPGQKVEDIWKELLSFIDKNKFAEGEKLVEAYTPLVNTLHYKYYFKAYLMEAQKKKSQAVEYYEKASFSNPHFWPAYFRLSEVLSESSIISEQKKRYNALVKVTTILEDKAAGNKYSWLMESFDSSYFYDLCNQYLKMSIQEWK